MRWIYCLAAGGAVSSAVGAAAAAVFDQSGSVQAVQHCQLPAEDDIEKARFEAQQLLAAKMVESGAPGISVTVHRDGRQVWSTGVGWSDVENRVPMTGRCVMRVASISKSVTVAAVARAVDRHLLDVHAPLVTYLPDYPPPRHDGKMVEITVDQLLRNRSGVRHYHSRRQLQQQQCRQLQRQLVDRQRRLARILAAVGRAAAEQQSADQASSPDTITPPSSSSTSPSTSSSSTSSSSPTSSSPSSPSSSSAAPAVTAAAPAVAAAADDDDQQVEEFLLREPFGSVGEALELFKNDELVIEPGSGFHYSTHGWTLVSAVLEKACGDTFDTIMTRMFDELGLLHTYLDRHEPLITNRGRYYVREKGGRLRNAPYVDCSYKWAGGGLLSTTGDLCRFADIICYSWQTQPPPPPAAGTTPPPSAAAVAHSAQSCCGVSSCDAGGVAGAVNHSHFTDSHCSDSQCCSGGGGAGDGGGTAAAAHTVAVASTSCDSAAGDKTAACGCTSSGHSHIPPPPANASTPTHHLHQSSPPQSTPPLPVPLPPFLQPATADWLWSVDEDRQLDTPSGGSGGKQHRYARGWFVTESAVEYGPSAARPQSALCAFHTGGAVGCSSAVLVLPSARHRQPDGPVLGVSVAIIANLEGVALRALASEIAHLFAR